MAKWSSIVKHPSFQRWASSLTASGKYILSSHYRVSERLKIESVAQDSTSPIKTDILSFACFLIRKEVRTLLYTFAMMDPTSPIISFWQWNVLTLFESCIMTDRDQSAWKRTNLLKRFVPKLPTHFLPLVMSVSLSQKMSRKRTGHGTVFLPSPYRRRALFRVSSSL